MVAELHTQSEGCLLEVTSLGQRAGTSSETTSLIEAIGKQLEVLEEEKEKGIRRAEDSNLVVGNVGLVLETTLRKSCHIFLAIEALNVMRMWVLVFGSRDVSAIISSEGSTLAQLEVEFLKQGLEPTCCLLPTNLTIIA